MLINRLANLFILALYFGLVIPVIWSDDTTFGSVGYAQNAFISSRDHQIEFPIPSPQIEHPSSYPVVCTQRRKSHCQSKPLVEEQIELADRVNQTTLSPSSTKTSFVQEKNEFLDIEIYVDRQHRNFQDEIIEIFDQSLLTQTWQDRVPIAMECYCDHRETLAYSFILGHAWSKRAKHYLQNLASQTPRIHVLNYGKGYTLCHRHSGKCQDVDRLQTAFRFLAIGKSEAGCLIRLKLPSSMSQQRMVLKEHPLFLQKIHVAGVWSRQTP